jgi:DNA polymerase-1
MGRADEVWTGVRKRQPVRVLSIQYVGEQEVIGIETDTNTFVAEGFLSHNSTDERKGTHDLEQLAVEVLGAPRYKTDARSYLPHKGASLRYLPPDILYQYNAADADVTHRLVEPLWKEVNHDGVARPYRELLIPGSNALAQTEYIGVKVDRGRLDELHTSLSDELQGLEEVLHRWVGNPRSPQQVARAFGRLGVGGDEGPSTTDKEFLKRVVERHKGEAREFAKQLLEHRQRSKLLSTYVVGLGKSLVRGRIHPTFLLHGTETGRLSCRRPNLQNIPSGSTIRDAFVSGPDNVLLSADYSQIEFRLAAILSGDEWLLEQFRSGREFHKEVARKFFGETWTPLQYLRAKAVNFGTLYGRQAKSLSDEWGMPIHEAQRLINDFFGAMPRVKEWQKNTEREIREQGYLESYFGRKRRFWLVTRENWHEVIKEGYAFKPQSAASDFTLQSLIRLEPILRGKAAPVITVHDSIIFEVRRQYLEEVMHTVKTVMENTGVQDICPTPVDLKVGSRWGSLKAA